MININIRELVRLPRINSYIKNKKLCIDNISKKTPILKGKDNMLALNTNNRKHREWYEIDKYKGE